MRSTLPTSHGFTPKGFNLASPFPKPSYTQPGAEQNTSEQSAAMSTRSAFVNAEKPAFIANFEYVGTIDSSPYLCIPTALEWRETVLGGESVIREYCHTLARAAGKHVAAALGTDVLENSTQTLGQCCMSNVRLPISLDNVLHTAAQSGVEKELVGVQVRDWMKRLSSEEYDTFIMVYWYAGSWWARLSAQVYLDMRDFEWAAQTLKKMCERVDKGEWAGVKGKL
jgi:hypothetical protein